MRLWITGIGGFLGSHLAESLTALGHEVSGNDSLICSSVSIERKLIMNCRYYNGMKRLFDKFQPETVIHCAATAHEGLSNFSPSFITKNIYEASVSTFSAAIAAGVKRIINFSSMARYGTQQLPFTEIMIPKPQDPYAIAKVASEQTLKCLCELHDIEYVNLVPHSIIGPRQKYDDSYRNVASIFINRALQDKPILVYGDGKQKRCFSPIADCLDSIVKCIDTPVSGETINIGPDGGEITINELAEKIINLTSSTAGIEHVGERPNEVLNAYCSSDKARKLLGFTTKQSLHDCLARMVLYIKKNGTKTFKYQFPIEISNKCPQVWLEKLL